MRKCVVRCAIPPILYENYRLSSLKLLIRVTCHQTSISGETMWVVWVDLYLRGGWEGGGMWRGKDEYFDNWIRGGFVYV